MLCVFFIPDAVNAAEEITIKKVSSVKASALSTSSIKISWKSISNVDGYKIYRYSPSKKKFISIKTIKKKSQNTYKDKKLKSNKTYKYKVQAFKKTKTKIVYGKKSKAVKATTKKSNSQKIVSKGKSRIGCRYVWATEGPKTFDCSGFVYWTYKNSGAKVKKKVPRSSCQGLYKSLKKYKVSSKLSKAKAGDIILYKNGSRYTHAAISLGNNKMIHASSSKKKVCIANTKLVKHSGALVLRVYK